MIAILAAAALLAQPSGSGDGFDPGFKIGFGFGFGFPSMSDEDLFAEEMEAAGIPFETDEVVTSGIVDLTFDASSRFKVRGGLGFGSFDGAYSEEYSSMDDVWLALLTLGFSSLFDSDEEVIDLADSYVEIETEGYYVISRSAGASFSAGGGPVFTFVNRSLESPLTSSERSGSAMGFMGSLRVEQEGGGRFIGLPLRLFAQGGYRRSCVALDEAEDFELDFSGPYLRAGLALQFR